jgi:hypothetical protein
MKETSELLPALGPLSWAGDNLLSTEGIIVARIWPYGNVWEWVVEKTIDPTDSTRGTSASIRAARRAVERAVKKFQYTVK